MRVRSTAKSLPSLCWASPFDKITSRVLLRITDGFPRVDSSPLKALGGLAVSLSHFNYLREDDDDVYKQIDPTDVLKPKEIVASVTLSDKLVLQEQMRNQRQQESFLRNNRPAKKPETRWASWLNLGKQKPTKKNPDLYSSRVFFEKYKLDGGQMTAIETEQDVDIAEQLDDDDDDDAESSLSGSLSNDLGKGKSSRIRLLGEELDLGKTRTHRDDMITPLDSEKVDEYLPSLNLGRRYDTGLKFDRTRPSLRRDRYSTVWTRAEIEPRKLRDGSFDTRPVFDFDLAKTEAVRYLGGNKLKPATSTESYPPVEAHNNDSKTHGKDDEGLKRGPEAVHGFTPLGEYPRQSQKSPGFRYMTNWKEVYDAFKMLEGEDKGQDISQAFFTLKHMKRAPPSEVLTEMADVAIENASRMMPISLTNTLHACAKMKFFYPPLIQCWVEQLEHPKVLEACTDLDITSLVYSFGVLNRLGKIQSLENGNWEKGLSPEFVELLAEEAVHPIRLDNYNQSMLVNIFYGLSLLKYNKTNNLNKFLSRISSDKVLPKLETANISALLYGIGHLKFWSPDMTTKILREAISRLSEFTSQSIASILWSLGNMRYPNVEIVGKLAEACSQEHHLRNCTEQDLVNVMYGLAMCKYRDPVIIAKVVSEVMKPGRLSQMLDVRLTQLLSSLSSLRYSNDQLFQAIVSELSGPKRLKRLSKVVIANVFYALGSCRFRHPDALQKLMDEVTDDDRISTFSEFDLATIITALGNMRVTDTHAFETLLAEARKPERLPRYSPQSLINIISACGLVQFRDEEFLAQVCQLLSDEKYMDELTTTGIALATTGLCRLQFFDQNFFGEYLKVCTSPDKIRFMRPSTLIDLMFGSMRAEVVDFAQFMSVVKYLRDPKILTTLMNFPLARLVTVVSLIGLRDEQFLDAIKQEVLRTERLNSLLMTDQRDLARAFERLTFYDEDLCRALRFGPRIKGQSVGILAPGGLQQFQNEEKMKSLEREKEEQNFDWSGRLRPTFYD